MTVKLGIAGLGTVGATTAKIITEDAALLAQRSGSEIHLKAVSARDKTKDRGFSMEGITWHDDPLALAGDPAVDVVVELIGGAEGVAYDLVKAALENGKHVVTANKALIARHGLELAGIAEKQGVNLKCEAAVAGGIPIIKALKEGLSANRFSRIAGILNGTCNYILTVMEEQGRDFDSVLKEAQDLGYAEADPSFDVDGVDAAHKLVILASMAFSTPVSIDSLHIEGIRTISSADIEYAKQHHLRIKLLGIAKRSDAGLELRVHPALVPQSASIAKVNGVLNAVDLVCEPLGTLLMEGPGAGGGATASSVLADVVDVAAGRGGALYNLPVSAFKSVPLLTMEDHQGAYYMRLNVQDSAGVMASISDVFHQAEISIASLIQEEQADGTATIMLTTHDTKESALNKTIETLSKLNSVIGAPQFIRIEG